MKNLKTIQTFICSGRTNKTNYFTLPTFVLDYVPLLIINTRNLISRQPFTFNYFFVNKASKQTNLFPNVLFLLYFIKNVCSDNSVAWYGSEEFFHNLPKIESEWLSQNFFFWKVDSSKLIELPFVLIIIFS